MTQPAGTGLVLLIQLELTRNVVDLAGVVRVRHGLRTPDALVG